MQDLPETSTELDKISIEVERTPPPPPQVVRESPVDKLVTFFSPTRGLERRRAKVQIQLINELAKRAYEGASYSRRTEGWLTPRTSADVEIRRSLILRDRARDLVRNSSHGNRGLAVIISNTISTGIIPSFKCGDPKKKYRIKNFWDDWAGTTAIDAEGRHDFYGLQALSMRSIVEGGECLVKIGKVNNTIPYTLQLLEPDFLDSTKVGRLNNGAPGVTDLAGGYVIQGVQFDSSGRRVGYWLYKEHPGGFINTAGYTGVSNFVPADSILHVYRCDRPGQTRGVSWYAPVLIAMKDLSDFEDAQLIKQRNSACFGYFIRTLDGGVNVGNFTADNNSEKKTAAQLSPGLAQYLGPQEDIVFANPPQLDNGYSEYVSKVLRQIAAGLGITYESLTGDLSQVNFSSGRMGFLEFQRNLDFWRWQMIIPQLCNPVWNLFKQALQIHGIDTRDVTCNWTPPRREMIDPTKEVPSINDGIRAGIYNLYEVLREQGLDPEEHLKEAAEAYQELDKLQLVFTCDPRKDLKTQATTPKNPDNSSDDEDADKGKEKNLYVN